MTQFVVGVLLIHRHLIEADSEEQAEKLVLGHKDLGLDLSRVFETFTRTKDCLDRIEPDLPYRTLSTE